MQDLFRYFLQKWIKTITLLQKINYETFLLKYRKLLSTLGRPLLFCQSNEWPLKCYRAYVQRIQWSLKLQE